MNSIASFTIETGGQKDRDAISKQHGDAFHALELPIEKTLWNPSTCRLSVPDSALGSLEGKLGGYLV